MTEGVTPDGQSLSDHVSEALDAEMAFQAWKFHVWMKGRLSASAVSQKIKSGDLIPFTCSVEECDCDYSKVTYLNYG